MSLSAQLLAKHSPGNRYAYYPSTKKWEVKEITGPQKIVHGAAIYFHLPFCRELCTFCGCNIRLSKKEEEHHQYCKTLIKEWELLFQSPKWCAQIEVLKAYPLENLILGGGTPSFLAPEAQVLLRKFLERTFVHGIKNGHTEASPKSFNRKFLEWARSIGINSFSFGVQDFNQKVLHNVNRKQEHIDLTRALDLLKEEERRGIDLIWGLPLQDKESMSSWKESLAPLDLDWISFYPLAKVPWLSTYQNALGDFTLPSRSLKYELYEQGVEILNDLGYIHFGFGHFVRKKGRLWQAYQNKELYRSVSGLFPKRLEGLLGLGVGAISEISDYLCQNDKIFERYQNSINHQNKLAHTKNHLQSSKEKEFFSMAQEIIHRGKMKKDCLSLFAQQERNAWFDANQNITENGRHFLKNILQRLEKDHFEEI